MRVNFLRFEFFYEYKMPMIIILKHAGIWRGWYGWSERSILILTVYYSELATDCAHVHTECFVCLCINYRFKVITS